MEGELAPQERRSNAKEIIINSPAMVDRDAVASYRLYTAGSPEAGRGTTPTIAHLSEVAFWQYDEKILAGLFQGCLLYTSPSPRDRTRSRMPSSA